MFALFLLTDRCSALIDRLAFQIKVFLRTQVSPHLSQLIGTRSWCFRHQTFLFCESRGIRSSSASVSHFQTSDHLQAATRQHFGTVHRSNGLQARQRSARSSPAQRRPNPTRSRFTAAGSAEKGNRTLTSLGTINSIRFTVDPIRHSVGFTVDPDSPLKLVDPLDYSVRPTPCLLFARFIQSALFICSASRVSASSSVWHREHG